MSTNLTNNLKAYGVGQPLIGFMPKPIVTNRNPGPHDKAAIGQIWINELANTAFILTGSANNQSIWGQYTNTVAGNLTVGGFVQAGNGLIALGGGVTSTGASSFTGTTTFNGATIFNGATTFNADISTPNNVIYAHAFQTVDPNIELYISQNGIYSVGSQPNVDVSVTMQGTGAFVIDSLDVTSNLNSQWRTTQAWVQTTDATQKILVSIPLALQEMILVKGYINGFKSTFDHAIGGEVTLGAFRPTGGNIAQIGNKVVSVYVDAGITAGVTIDVAVNVPTQSLNVYVTGAVAETWNWVTTYSYMYTTHP
jgi:hypothetical protein